MKVKRPQHYGNLRRLAYPERDEQIGALVKAVKALNEGKPLPAEALAVIAEVDAVKRRFPQKKGAPKGP